MPRWRRLPGNLISMPFRKAIRPAIRAAAGCPD